MIGKARVLLSARDPGAVGHICALVDAFRADERFDVEVVASGAALPLLTRAGESPRAFALADGRDHLEAGESPTPLLETVARLLAERRPDAVLVSLSSFGVGVDEALLATARVPTFAMQDFPGDVNLGLGVAAGLYFVLDEAAAVASRMLWGVRVLAVGSPKHARYAALDVAAMRAGFRRSVGIGAGEKVVGFFGQSPRMPGHEAAFGSLLAALPGVKPPGRLLLREHPKFATERAAHIAQAEALGLRVIDASDEEEPEASLAACDVVATPFSSCGLDYAYLSACSLAPLGSVLYVVSNPELRAFAERACGGWPPSVVQRGLGLTAESPEQIRPALEQALSDACVTSFFTTTKTLLTEDPCRRVVAAVAAVLGVARVDDVVTAV